MTREREAIDLVRTPKNNLRLLQLMESHYSKPRGFVGRSLCYAVISTGEYYGHIVAGSATLHLPGRDEFFGVASGNLSGVVNNTFYSVHKLSGRYPIRNFSTAVIERWMAQVCIDWAAEYGDEVIGFETLVEPPRTGELYRRAGFHQVGITAGYQCKRVSGSEGGRFSGRRVWFKDKQHLRPKIVLCRMAPRDLIDNVGRGA